MGVDPKQILGNDGGALLFASGRGAITTPDPDAYIATDASGALVAFPRGVASLTFAGVETSEAVVCDYPANAHGVRLTPIGWTLSDDEWFGEEVRFLATDKVIGAGFTVRGLCKGRLYATISVLWEVF